jgi:hypothetical protein
MGLLVPSSSSMHEGRAHEIGNLLRSTSGACGSATFLRRWLRWDRSRIGCRRLGMFWLTIGRRPTDPPGEDTVETVSRTFVALAARRPQRSRPGACSSKRGPTRSKASMAE